MNHLKDLDIVVLTEDRQTRHFETGEPITLFKGEVGTIVMEYDGNSFEVEFSNNDGTTYAMETIPAHQLMLLQDELVEAAV
jgi:ribosomal protein L21E